MLGKFCTACVTSTKWEACEFDFKVYVSRTVITINNGRATGQANVRNLTDSTPCQCLPYSKARQDVPVMKGYVAHLQLNLTMMGT